MNLVLPHNPKFYFHVRIICGELVTSVSQMFIVRLEVSINSLTHSGCSSLDAVMPLGPDLLDSMVVI
jgi:hypothetical protein